MDRERFLREKLEEDSETRFFTKSKIDNEYLERQDHMNAWYMELKRWFCWMFMIIPIRLFNVFFFLFIYAMWYQVFVRTLSKIPVLRRCSTCLDYWIKKYYVPFFSWFFMFQLGFYRPKLIEVEKEVFETVCKKYQGKPGKPEKKKPYICISNHVGYIDHMIMFKHFGERGVIANNNLRHDPFLSKMLREIGCIFTDSKNIVQKIMERSDEYYREPRANRKLLIYPEGTTTNGTKLLKFHRGAFVSKKPLDIGFIRYKYHHFDPSFSNCDMMKYLETMYSQIYQDYYFLKFPVYNPNEEEKEDTTLFARNVRLVMCDIANYYTAEKFGEIELVNVLYVRHPKKKKIE